MAVSRAKKTDVLINKKIKLVPVIREGGMNPKGHDGEFMYTGTVMRFVVPFNLKKGRLEFPLNETEREVLEAELDQDLNPYKKENNFWRSYEIIIRKDESLMFDGMVLDLSDPIDFVKYKVLLVQPEVAPSWEERYDKGEYRFALIDINEVVNEDAANIDKKSKAYVYLDNIKHSHQKMSDVLRAFGRKQSASTTLEFMKTEIDKLINNKTTLNKLIDLIDDPDHDMKIFINEAVDCGAILVNNGRYTIPGGDFINSTDPTLYGTVAKLNELKAITDEVFMKIHAQVKQSR
jgi:hypothetical protein